MNRSDKIEQVAASLFALNRDLVNPRKDSKADTGKFSYTYLSLPKLIEHLRPKLTEYQLYVSQEITGGGGFVEVTTTVWHLSGQFIEFGPTFMPFSGDAQQAGSATTYARRYSLAAVFNLAADEDDDGASSTKRRSDWGAKKSGGTDAMLPPDNGAASAANVSGEGAAAGAAPLTDEEVRKLAERMAIGRNDLLKLARAAFGSDKVLSTRDITHEMAEELAP